MNYILNNNILHFKVSCVDIINLYFYWGLQRLSRFFHYYENGHGCAIVTFYFSYKQQSQNKLFKQNCISVHFYMRSSSSRLLRHFQQTQKPIHSCTWNHISSFSNTFQTFHLLYLQHFPRLKNAAKLILTQYVTNVSIGHWI